MQQQQQQQRSMQQQGKGRKKKNTRGKQTHESINNDAMEHDHSSSEAELVGQDVSGIAEIAKATVTALLPSIITEVRRAVEDANQMNMESIQDENQNDP